MARVESFPAAMLGEVIRKVVSWPGAPTVGLTVIRLGIQSQWCYLYGFDLDAFQKIPQNPGLLHASFATRALDADDDAVRIHGCTRIHRVRRPSTSRDGTMVVPNSCFCDRHIHVSPHMRGPLGAHDNYHRERTET